MYCRTFQTIFRIAIPILPYHEPIILHNNDELVKILQDNNVKSVLFKVVSDDGNGQAWDQNVTSVSQILAKFIVDFLKEDLKRFI